MKSLSMKKLKTLSYKILSALPVMGMCLFVTQQHSNSMINNRKATTTPSTTTSLTSSNGGGLSTPRRGSVSSTGSGSSTSPSVKITEL